MMPKIQNSKQVIEETLTDILDMFDQRPEEKVVGTLAELIHRALYKAGFEIVRDIGNETIIESSGCVFFDLKVKCQKDNCEICKTV